MNLTFKKIWTKTDFDKKRKNFLLFNAPWQI
jgi:hypothetical protein